MITSGSLETNESATVHTVAPAPLSVTSRIAVVGHLTWLAGMWALVAVGYAIAIGAISIWGSIDQSLWEQGFAGWQRWPIGAAGLMMATVYGPMFITNGVSRTRLARSTIVTMIVIAVVGSIYVMAGFAIEAAVFDANGWTHKVNDIRSFDDVGMARIGLGFLLVFAAYFVGGWIVGVAFQTRRLDGRPRRTNRGRARRRLRDLLDARGRHAIRFPRPLTDDVAVARHGDQRLRHRSLRCRRSPLDAGPLDHVRAGHAMAGICWVMQWIPPPP